MFILRGRFVCKLDYYTTHCRKQLRQSSDCSKILISYPLLSSDVCKLDCPHGHLTASAMPESCPLELTEVMEVSCPFLNMGSVVALTFFVIVHLIVGSSQGWTRKVEPAMVSVQTSDRRFLFVIRYLT